MSYIKDFTVTILWAYAVRHSSPCIILYVFLCFPKSIDCFSLSSLQCELSAQDLFDNDKYPLTFFDMCILDLDLELTDLDAQMHTKHLDTLRPRQNGRHFANNTFKCIFLNENVRISIKIILKFVHKGPINNIPALIQIMSNTVTS